MSTMPNNNSQIGHAFHTYPNQDQSNSNSIPNMPHFQVPISSLQGQPNFHSGRQKLSSHRQIWSHWSHQGCQISECPIWGRYGDDSRNTKSYLQVEDKSHPCRNRVGNESIAEIFHNFHFVISQMEKCCQKISQISSEVLKLFVKFCTGITSGTIASK